MPRIERWENRAISIADLNQLRLWIDTKHEVLEDAWYKNFGSFKICGHGALAKTSCFVAR